MKKITLTFCDGKTAEVAEGTFLHDIAEKYNRSSFVKTVAAVVNNKLTELTKTVTDDCNVRFLDLASLDGRRIYERSLIFLLTKAARDLYPDRRVFVRHSVRNGIYFEIEGASELLPEELEAIEKRMHELSARNIPFIRTEIQMSEAEDLFDNTNRKDLYNAIKERNKSYVIFYDFDGCRDYFYGYMAPHSGYVNQFSLFYHYPGAILSYPAKGQDEKHTIYHDMPKLLTVFSEYKKWGHILGIENVGEYNSAVRGGGAPDLIRIAEALQEKKIAQIADMITNGPDKKKIVFIAGPSSSGKTTFSNRLSIQLRANGYMTYPLSMDEYYLNRDLCPVDASGKVNLECPESLDIELFSKQMNALIGGATVEVPIYNFKRGRREDSTRPMHVGDNEILIVEGIHGLNPRISARIPKEYKFKIYISALTSLNIDDHNRIPTTDTRMIRRIVRDNQFRGTSAIETLRMWPSVKAGEEEHIFPYQESCDVMFNSALIYELGTMKPFAMPLLEEIDHSYEEYPEVVRLTKFLSYFAPVDIGDIPTNSILREFLGGSCFYVQ